MMQLMMYIGDDHIESVRLDPERVSKPGYLGSFKRNMKVKYSDLIKQHGAAADFIVVGEVKDNYSETIKEFTRNEK
jgi:hypothetical protein